MSPNKSKPKKIDSVQNPDTIKELLDAAGIGYHDKFPKKLASKIQPVIILNFAAMLKQIYPVGSIYISTLSTNPNTLLGFGTWISIAAGRVLVGLDSGDADFDTVEQTGGAKTHTHSIGSHAHYTGVGWDSGNNAYMVGDNPAYGSRVLSGVRHSHAVGNAVNAAYREAETSSSSGTTGSRSNVSPYFVVHMWKRTA